MAERGSSSEQRAAEEEEQRNPERFIARAARHHELQARLKGVDPYEVVEIAAVEVYHLGVFTLQSAACTGYVMPKVRQ